MFSTKISSRVQNKTCLLIGHIKKQKKIPIKPPHPTAQQKAQKPKPQHPHTL